MTHTAVLVFRFGERVCGWRELDAICLAAKAAAAVVAFEA